MEFFLGAIELGESAKIGGTMIVAALVESNVGLDLPAIEGRLAMRAPEFGAFGFSQAALDLREAAADLAAQLRALLAVVEPQILAGRTAVTARMPGGNVACGGVASDGPQRLTVRGLIVGPQSPPVLRGRNGLGWRGNHSRRMRVHNELAVVRMLPAKVIADFDLAIATSRLGVSYPAVEVDLRKRWQHARSVLVAFGSPRRGIGEILAREGLTIDEAFHLAINAVPEQGTETVRTEEAVFASLALLNLLG